MYDISIWKCQLFIFAINSPTTSINFWNRIHFYKFVQFECENICGNWTQSVRENKTGKKFDKLFFIKHQHNLPVHPRRHILITFIAGQSNSTPNKTIRMVSTFDPTHKSKKKVLIFVPEFPYTNPWRL